MTAACGVAIAPTPALAQVTWDANTGSTGPQDGSGTWSTVDANWWNGTTDVVWPNLTTSSAIIGANSGAAGTITASGSLTLNAITFNAPGSGTYTLSGGTLGFAGSSPTITANANATIESAITSGAGLTKAGTGNLTLAGIITNTSGGMSFSRGTVTLTGTLTNTSANTFAIGSSNGGMLTIAGGTLSTSGGGARSVVIAGGAGQSGTVAVTSGFFSPVGMLVSEDNGGNGVFTQSGGTTTIGASSLWLTGNSSTLSVSGGSFTAPTMYTNFGNSNSATTITVSGSGSLTATTVQVGTSGRNGINLNLNVGDGTGGGLFQANSFSWGGATGTATINFNSGTFVGNATHSLPTQIATVVKSGGANISVAASQTLTMSNPLTDGGGGGGLRKLGAGTLSLTGSNTYTGTTSIAAGSLSIGNALALQNSTLDLNASDAGTVSAISQNSTLGGLTGSRNLDMATRTLSIGNNGASTTYSGTLSNGALTKIGSGTLTLTASNAYSGATTISAGALALSTAGSLATTGTVAITGVGATFDISAASAGRTIGMLTGTAGSSVALGPNSLTVGDATTGTFAGGIGGTGGLTKQGAGTLVLSGSSDYSGGTTINNGTIVLSGAGTLGSGTAGLTFGGGALDLGGLSVSAGNVSITSAPASGNQIQNGTLTGTAFSVSNTSGVSTISASLAGVGAALSKSGAGTLALSGSNSFSGGVTLTGGQVQIANANALGTGVFTTNVDVDTAIVFNLPSSGTVANNFTINKPGSNRTYYFQQNQANNLTLPGNITVASGNGNRFSLSGASTGTFTLTGSNTFGADVGTSANMTFRIGGTNAAGTGLWRPDGTTKLVLLDGANFRAGVGNYIASFSMESSGTATISGNVWNRNTANVAIITPAGAQLTFAGTIFAEGGFTTGTFSKTGAGTWVITNSGAQMTYNLLGGTLQVPSFTALGGSSAASYVVLDGGSLRYAGAAASTAREFTLGANGGSLDASGSGSAAFTSTAAVSFTGSGDRTLTLTGTNTGNNTLAMAINDNGGNIVSLSKTGAGTWVLSGSNAYSGSTSVSAGRLVVANANALGTGTATVGGGVLDVGSLAATVGGFTITSGSLIGSGTLTSTTAYGMQSGSVLANLGGSVALVKSTGGTVTLSGNNTYSNGTQIADGTLQLGSSMALPTSSALTLGTGSTAGVLAFNGNTATLGAITFNGSGSQLSGTALGGKLNLLASGTANATITVNSGSHALHPDTTLQSNTVINLTADSYFSLHGVIDGSKSLTQLGSGTLAIYGANSYSGGTYLSGGYLSVQNTGALGSGTVTIDGNSILNLNNTILANTVVFGSGSGAIINSGSLVNVTGTYSITSGTGTSITTNYSVQPGGDISFVSNLASTVYVQGTAQGTFSSDVLNAGTVIVNAGGRGVFSGGISGNVTTSGSSLFSGDVLGNVTVAGGTATFTAATGAGSAINVNSGLGVVTGTIGNTAHATAAGATLEIRGRVLSTADVNAEAGATVKLMGSQAFDGTTIDNGGSVIVDRTANLVLGAVISGSGSLTKSDNLALTLTGNNTYSGLTTISGGTLSVGNGGSSGALAGNVVNNAAILFNRSDDTTYAGNISGSGGLTKLGSGKLSLTGSHSFAGPTTVSAGILAVNGQIGGNAVVLAGGTLGGSGSVGGTLSGAGLVSPGNSPGILTASQFDPSGGLDSAFEFTGLSPIYTSSTASGNDVTRLTNLSNPFASGTFTAANVIDVYFNVDSIVNGQIYEGGFFTGLSAEDLFAALDGKATFHYWAKTTGAADRSFNGFDYVSLTSLSGITGATFQTAARTADFGSGAVSGSVTQFVIVPEPTAVALACIGSALVTWAAVRRRGQHGRVKAR